MYFGKRERGIDNVSKLTGVKQSGAGVSVVVKDRVLCGLGS
jgi:hypothetical protein